MPCQTETLRRYRSEMLAPAFASLLALYEAAIGRCLTVGTGSDLTDDEVRLAEWLQGERGEIAKRDERANRLRDDIDADHDGGRFHDPSSDRSIISTSQSISFSSSGLVMNRAVMS